MYVKLISSAAGCGSRGCGAGGGWTDQAPKPFSMKSAATKIAPAFRAVPPERPASAVKFQVIKTKRRASRASAAACCASTRKPDEHHEHQLHTALALLSLTNRRRAAPVLMAIRVVQQKPQASSASVSKFLINQNEDASIISISCDRSCSFARSWRASSASAAACFASVP